MELITELTTTVPKEIVYFDYLTVDLTPQGTLVKAKSKIFAEWIRRGQASEPLDTCTIKGTPSKPCLLGPDGLKLYYPKDRWNYSVPYGVAQIGAYDYFVEEKPNLIWLFTTDLEQGTEVLFRQPISLNNWEDYFTSCCKVIQDIWYKELRTVSITAKFKERLEDAQL